MSGDGYGTFQFSKDTLRMMATMLGRSNESRKVNSIFGEGVNPLMRKIRDGLGLLGLQEDELLKHGSRRIVHGVALAIELQGIPTRNGRHAKVSDYAYAGEAKDELIADFWRHVAS